MTKETKEKGPRTPRRATRGPLRSSENRALRNSHDRLRRHVLKQCSLLPGFPAVLSEGYGIKNQTHKFQFRGFNFHPFDAAEHRRDFAIERAVSERP